MLPQLKVSLLGFENIADNTVEMRLKTPGNFQFTAGQYVTVTIPSLQDGPVYESFHDFSIASSPNEEGLIRIVFRKSSSIFKQTLLALKPGDKVELEGPSGIFTLPKNQPVIAVAGGIGITPFLSMLGDGHTSFELLYYNRTPQTAIYLARLEKLLGPKLYAYFEGPNVSQLNEIYLKNPSSIWFIAGPPPMAAHCRTLLKTLFVDDTMIRTEEFSGYGKNEQ